MSDSGGVRSRLLVVLALVLSAGLAGGAAVALVKASDDQGSTRAAPAPLPVVTTTPTPVPSETPTPAPAPSPTAAPTPTATPSATPVATATPSRSVTRFYAFPKPTRSYQGLYVSASSSASSGTTQDTFTVTVDATDGDGTLAFGGLTWGDGSSIPAQAGPATCAPRPSPTAQPGPYQPHADSRTFVYKHRFSTSGPYTATITITSGNNCRPNGPATESETVKLGFTIA